jgi:hypothetical protein
MRMYEPAWLKLKNMQTLEKQIIISAARGWHRRIKKAIIKEKDMDIVYKFILDSEFLYSRLHSSSIGNKLTLTLELKQQYQYLHSIGIHNMTTLETIATSDSHTDIKHKLLELEAQLLANDPMMPVLLSKIHKQLKAQPETATLLTDEEISIIVAGLEVQTNNAIAASISKKSSANNRANKAIANASLEDLGLD